MSQYDLSAQELPIGVTAVLTRFMTEYADSTEPITGASPEDLSSTEPMTGEDLSALIENGTIVAVDGGLHYVDSVTGMSYNITTLTLDNGTMIVTFSTLDGTVYNLNAAGVVSGVWIPEYGFDASGVPNWQPSTGPGDSDVTPGSGLGEADPVVMSASSNGIGRPLTFAEVQYIHDFITWKKSRLDQSVVSKKEDTP